MMIFETVLLTFLLVCAIAVSLTKNLLASVVIFMSYSLIVSIIWFLLGAPDLAITEAAVGAGITSTLFFITLQKIKQLKDADEEREDEK